MRKQDATHRAQMKAIAHKQTVELWSRKQNGAVAGTPRDWRFIATDDNIDGTAFEGFRFEGAFNRTGTRMAG